VSACNDIVRNIICEIQQGSTNVYVNKCKKVKVTGPVWSRGWIEL